MTTRELTDCLERAVAETPAGELPAIIGELARLQAIAHARLVSGAENGRGAVPEAPDELLDAEQAARRLGVSVDCVYRRKDWPFRVCIGRRVRFSAREIERFIRQRQGR